MPLSRNAAHFLPLLTSLSPLLYYNTPQAVLVCATSRPSHQGTMPYTLYISNVCLYPQLSLHSIQGQLRIRQQMQNTEHTESRGYSASGCC
ncbi:hypothetical protein B0T17DRAFT_40043 [Bombardia bombarda]|uniref:Secreted protein n=1 Tax=Bombardia bombarda TaxID=252184 RepID=A0AA39XLB4_9PEZI|nr:hypothetical protein B0T17DRAFT_40043 [Bombardia bombarda]